MAGSFNQSIDEATHDFEKYIKPIVPYMFNGFLVPVENDDNEACKVLDLQCGIDYLLVCKNHTYGVASRIQTIRKSWKPFNTFTVRVSRDSNSPTEREKRIHSIMLGSLYPKVTYQAYVDGDELLSMAVCYTRELFDYLLTCDTENKHTNGEQIGQAKFAYIPWKDYMNARYHMRVYTNSSRRVFTCSDGVITSTTDVPF